MKFGTYSLANFSKTFNVSSLKKKNELIYKNLISKFQFLARKKEKKRPKKLILIPQSDPCASFTKRVLNEVWVT
jgi:hypothetical protein